LLCRLPHLTRLGLPKTAVSGHIKTNFSSALKNPSQKENQFQFSLMSVRVADGAMRIVLHQS
jgi:hypothetical protein